MKLSFKIFIAALLFVYCCHTHAQTDTSCSFTLQGNIIDEHNQEKLEYSTLFIRELNNGAVADSAGFYKIKGLCPGIFHLVISHVGCQPLEKVITLKGDTFMVFLLEHHADLLKTVKITATREPEKTSLSKTEIRGTALSQLQGQTLGDIAKTVAGVTSLQTGASISKPVIHGLHSNRILLLNNGVRQEGQQWGNEHGPEIDPFIAGKVTIIKGANSVRYGSDAIAGVILVEPNNLRDSAGMGGELNLAGFSNGQQGAVAAMLEGNFSKLPAFSWRLQGTLKKGGNIQAPDYYLKNTGLQEYNFSWAAGYRKERFNLELFYSQFNTDVGIFRGSHIGNLTDLRRAFESDTLLYPSGFSYKIDRPYQHIEHELFKAKGYVVVNHIGTLHFLYSRQFNYRTEYDAHLPRNNYLASLNLPSLEFKITTYTADTYLEHRSWGKLKSTLGINGITQANTYTGRYFIPNFENFSGGIYWIEHLKFKKLELEGGVRFDTKLIQVYKWEKNIFTTPNYHYNGVSGTSGIIYTFNDKNTVTLNYSRAWRAPGVNELYSDGLHHGAAAVEFGNKNLNAEQSDQLISTYNYDCHCIQKNTLEITGYHNYLSDFIYLKPQLPPTLTIRGAFPTFQYSQADVSLTGIDVMAKKALWPRIIAGVKGSLLRAWNYTDNNYLINMPTDRVEGELKYEFKNTKKINDSYVGVSYSFVSKQTRVPANSDFVPPPGAYSLLNLQIGSTFVFNKLSIETGLTINNLLNTSYRDYMDRFRYYTNAMGRNIAIHIRIPINISNGKKESVMK